MITVNKNSIGNSQKIMIKESKNTTTKSHQITKEDSKRESKKQQFYKTVRKLLIKLQ